MTNVFTPKSAKKFSCKECDFECSKRSDWSRHISTQKHKIRTNTNDFTPKTAEQYNCNCGTMLFVTSVFMMLDTNWVNYWVKKLNQYK